MGSEILIGAILPPLIDFVNRAVKNSRARFVISFMVCLLVGALFNLGSINFNSVTEILSSGALVFASAQVVYKTYWEKSELRTQI